MKLFLFPTCSILWIGLVASVVEAQNSVIPEEPVQKVLTYLEPYRSLEIYPVESGVIASVSVEKGDAVEEGEEILRLDSEIIEARLDIARAQADNVGRIQAAEAEYKLANEQLNKIEGLERRGSANEAEVARNRAAVEGAEGNLIATREDKKVYELQVRQIEAELERRIIRSPVDGTVVDITKDVSEPVTMSQAREDAYLVRVVQLHLLRSEAYVPEEVGVHLSIGDTLEVHLENGQVAIGKVDFVSPVTDPSTNTVAVRITIENGDGRFRAGSRGFLHIPRVIGD